MVSVYMDSDIDFQNCTTWNALCSVFIFYFYFCINRQWFCQNLAKNVHIICSSAFNLESSFKSSNSSTSQNFFEITFSFSKKSFRRCFDIGIDGIQQCNIYFLTNSSDIPINRSITIRVAKYAALSCSAMDGAD